VGDGRGSAAERILFMVVRPEGARPRDVRASLGGEALSRAARVIIDLVDVVGSVRDGEHLQCLVFLAQEFGLLPEPVFLFGSMGPDPRHPHSLLLEDHFFMLLRDGIIDLDGSGRLRTRRDLFALPCSGLTGRRLAALSDLSPAEAALFAAAVLCLAGEGRHAGSARHDNAFSTAVTQLATSGDMGQSVDVSAICAARQRLMPAEPVLLTPV
jgi:hypothetical protein